MPAPTLGRRGAVAADALQPRGLRGEQDSTPDCVGSAASERFLLDISGAFTEPAVIVAARDIRAAGAAWKRAAG